MEIITARAMPVVKPTIQPWIRRAMTMLRGDRLRRLVRAALEGMNAAPRDVPPQSFRFPFP